MTNSGLTCIHLRVTATRRVLARVVSLIAGRGYEIIELAYANQADAAHIRVRVSGPAAREHNLLCRLTQLVDVLEMSVEHDG